MSPCTGNCHLNNTTNICEGCGRSINEIVEWTRMTDEEKQQVMDKHEKHHILEKKSFLMMPDKDNDIRSLDRF